MVAEAENCSQEEKQPLPPATSSPEGDCCKATLTPLSPEGKKKRLLLFRDKCFETRPSLLTELFEKTDLVVLHNFFTAAFVLALMYTMLNDGVNQRGNVVHHLWLVVWNFRDLPAVLAFWCCMMASTVLGPYFGLRIWSALPVSAERVAVSGQLHWIALYVAYIVAMFYVPLRFLFYMELNCGCSFIITCENTRLLMKVHSFIRENVPRGVQLKLAAGRSSQTKDPAIARPMAFPRLEQFLYYMFCPAFVYRDEYPRSGPTNWVAVGSYCCEIACLILFTSMLFIDCVMPYFEPIDYRQIDWSFIVTAIFPSIVPGLLCLMFLFYGLLHCWLNIFCEIMQFGDRQFYSSWWNSRTMAEYYRNWNLVVHDWLYTYVYRDVATLIGGKVGLNVAQTAVFFISALFHEYWFGIAFRLFYPVMFMLYFVFGGIFFFVSKICRFRPVVWNIAMWFNLLIGTGMFIAFYSMEWYARQRCAPLSDNFYLDLLLPRHWMCR